MLLDYQSVKQGVHQNNMRVSPKVVEEASAVTAIAWGTLPDGICMCVATVEAILILRYNPATMSFKMQKVGRKSRLLAEHELEIIIQRCMALINELWHLFIQGSLTWSLGIICNIKCTYS